MRKPPEAIRCFLCLLWLTLSPLAHAQPQAPETELKAAILVNMLLFVDWPSQASQPTDRLTLCYFDPSPIAAVLDQLNGKLLKGKPLRVQPVTSTSVSGCHALYLSPRDLTKLVDVVPNLRSNGVLLIGDSPGYLQRGVMLNLDVDDGRIVFDIDLHSAHQAGLMLSSKMLRLARKVVE
jgi:hypothetical protein